MKHALLLLSLALLGAVVGLALVANPSITGHAQTFGPTDFSKSLQVGVVILAALGILGITLLNVTHE